jgi:hypothetical protein
MGSFARVRSVMLNFLADEAFRYKNFRTDGEERVCAEAVVHTEVIRQNYVASTLNEPVLHFAGRALHEAEVHCGVTA